MILISFRIDKLASLIRTNYNVMKSLIWLLQSCLRYCSFYNASLFSLTSFHYCNAKNCR